MKSQQYSIYSETVDAFDDELQLISTCNWGDSE